MGLLLEQSRRADEAREAYGNAIEFAPDLIEAHYRYGVMSYTAGELENAFYSLNRVVKLAPRSTMAEDARKVSGAFAGRHSSGGVTPFAYSAQWIGCRSSR